MANKRISNQVKTNMENHRKSDGKFGEQPKHEPSNVSMTLRDSGYMYPANTINERIISNAFEGKYENSDHKTWVSVAEVLNIEATKIEHDLEIVETLPNLPSTFAQELRDQLTVINDLRNQVQQRTETQGKFNETDPVEVSTGNSYYDDMRSNECDTCGVSRDHGCDDCAEHCYECVKYSSVGDGEYEVQSIDSHDLRPKDPHSTHVLVDADGNHVREFDATGLSSSEFERKADKLIDEAKQA